ncbi:hypothetical protein CWS43_03175 [Rahnella sp. AA]|nr:hypothetical protein CWS43_03175 [Rahnella sp. AA]
MVLKNKPPQLKARVKVVLLCFEYDDSGRRGQAPNICAKRAKVEDGSNQRSGRYGKRIWAEMDEVNVVLWIKNKRIGCDWFTGGVAIKKPQTLAGCGFLCSNGLIW